MSLGRLTVQSALGEPLRAEIEIPEITTEEALSLRVSIASPEAFTAAGLEYNAALQGMQLSLQRRPDGRVYVQLSTTKFVSEPYVDVILEARWAAGRIVRDYTMLFDPPALRQAAAPTLPQTSATGSASSRPAATLDAAANTGPASTTAPVAAATAPSAPATPAATAPAAAIPRTPATAPAPAPAPTPKASTAAEASKITVKPGDTASKIANRIKSGGVSLDQMLVALLRGNPEAFSNDNINRLRAGAVLDIPSTEDALQVSPNEASQIVFAQSKDFNEFRRNLAANVAKADVQAPSRAASGKVEAQVEDKKPAGNAPDKLTLSKGVVPSKADEARIAKERADKEAAARASEIAKNISDLSKLSAAASSAVPSAAAPKPAVPASEPASAPPAVSVAAALPASAPASVAAAAPAVAASAQAMAPAAAPAPAASAAKPAPPPPAPVEAPGLLDELLADPIVPAAATGLIALLAGFAFWRQRQRKKGEQQVDSAFLASRLQPDSFFGASGGQQVDTTSGAPTDASSSNFNDSQMGSPDEVDPVAEADVYLAYGRDTQAEEILKSALVQTPDRVAIHAKLASIYAKRRDALNLETAARNVLELAGANSPEWSAVAALGLELDPRNALYGPGGAALDAPASAAEPEDNPTLSMEPAPAGPVTDVDLDLDLDFSADSEPAAVAAPEAPAAPEAAASAALPDVPLDAGLDFEVAPPEPAAQSLPDLSLDLDMASPASPPAEEAAAAPQANDIDFDLALDEPAAPEPAPAPAAAPAPAGDGMLEFDLGSLSLDLDAPAAAPAAAASPPELNLDLTPEQPAVDGEDPLETKLALAEEFVSIGDTDGARALIEEVVAEASGALRAKAEQALAKLS